MHVISLHFSEAVALRGPPCAAATDGQFFQATESPWRRGVSVAWHPWCTSCWQVDQDGAVNHESSAACWQGRWANLLTKGGCFELLIRHGLASTVHPVLGQSSWKICHMLARKMVSSSGTQRPPESWSQYGLASVVHCLLVDGSGRGSCLERPVKCCRNRWSILLSNRVPMESWSQCGLASMAHLVLAGGSGWDSYDGTSPITWQGRWSVLLSHKGPRNPDVGMAWPPWCTPAGGWLRTGSHLERPDACFHNRWSILLSNRVTMESCSQCGPASMVHLVLAGGSGWVSYHGTSAIRWQGRWSVLLGYKCPRSPGVSLVWPLWCTPAGGWLRTGQL
ncbi:uncharacterized protein LOC104650394 isoform X2 [Saimiri boliviensis]|uniref:uncharacterized protein LOC104650394 isoform X2 n=1 Tax=Saimiri boliviensis TaxID=27679 RepID=UPI003D7755FF